MNEKDYPYVANLSTGCQFNQYNLSVGIEGGSANITYGDENELL